MKKIVLALVLTSMLSPAFAAKDCTEKRKADNLDFLTNKAELLLQNKMDASGINEGRQQALQQVRALIARAKQPGVTCEQALKMKMETDKIINKYSTPEYAS